MSTPTPGMGTLLPACAAFSVIAMAMAVPAPAPSADRHATAALICATDALKPGSTATLGLSFKIEKDWHLYWNGRNDSGSAPSAELKLPPGFTTDAWQWPAPKRHLQPGDILDHVYEDAVTLLIPVNVPSTAKPGSTITITAKAEWLVCNEACVPEDDTLTITLPIVAADKNPKPSENAKLIEHARSRLPKPFPTDKNAASVTWTDSKAEIRFAGATTLAFFPHEDCLALTDAVTDTIAKGNRLGINVKMEADKSLHGILEVRQTGKGGIEYYLVDSKPTLGRLLTPIDEHPVRPTHPSEPDSPIKPPRPSRP